MSHITTRDDTKLYVKDWGSGRPVILIHGWPLSADTWDDVAIAIADAGLRAIAYDRRGFGRSSQPFSGYDYDTLADDLADVIDESDARDATIVGFSMGGGEVARHLRRARGPRVDRAVFIASVVPGLMKSDSNPDGVLPGVFDEMADGIARDRAAFWPGFFRTFYGVGMISQPVSDDVISWSCAIAMQAGLHPTLACARAFATTDFRADVAAITVPTLILHGTADQTVPIEATGRRTAAAIAGSQLIEYDGAPHGLLASHTSQVIEDVLSFVTDGRVTTSAFDERDPAAHAPFDPVPGPSTIV
jgi:non-heme chloroperoxidase